MLPRRTLRASFVSRYEKPNLGPDRDVVHAVDVEDGVMALHEIDAQAHAGCQPRRRLPRVLDIHADVAILGVNGRHRRWRSEAAMKWPCSSAHVVGIEHHVLFE